MKINCHAKNLDGEGCLVREAEVKFSPKTREAASLKSKLAPRTTSQKMKDKAHMTAGD
jgi:hypothetical protein